MDIPRRRMSIADAANEAAFRHRGKGFSPYETFKRPERWAKNKCSRLQTKCTRHLPQFSAASLFRAARTIAAKATIVDPTPRTSNSYLSSKTRPIAFHLLIKRRPRLEGLF